MTMYHNAGGQGAPPNLGQTEAAFLDQARLANQQHYAPPTRPQDTEQPHTGLRQGEESQFNLHAGQPVKYTVPTATKEHFQAKHAIRQAAGTGLGPGVIRTDPITEEEVDYLQGMKKQAELADFDRYVNSLIDIRKPGNLKWLMEIYPSYVERRIQQVHTDYEYALRKQMISQWGINTFDDLHFQYLVDQEKIKGPELSETTNYRDEYAAGSLSPWAFVDKRKSGIGLPFNNAMWRPTGGDADARLNDGNGAPMGLSRDMQTMAQSMYPSTDDVRGIARWGGTRQDFT